MTAVSLQVPRRAGLCVCRAEVNCPVPGNLRPKEQHSKRGASPARASVPRASADTCCRTTLVGGPPLAGVITALVFWVLKRLLYQLFPDMLKLEESDL